MIGKTPLAQGWSDQCRCSLVGGAQELPLALKPSSSLDGPDHSQPPAAGRLARLRKGLDLGWGVRALERQFTIVPLDARVTSGSR